MNDASDCHVIPDLPGIYVDAFHGTYLTQKSKSVSSTLILTHYHGDHFRNLPRDGKYEGPALIHCTEITAALLVRVHGVPERLVVSHALGETWSSSKTKITFYDANHCPGAAMVLFQSSSGRVYLHTGDCRYHERMKSFPLLREAALNRMIDVVLLDTTFAHPKHGHMPQDEAVDLIASQAFKLLQPEEPKTLVLLSCYSIGKEKVLWEVVQRTGQILYANERKRRMLECIVQRSSDETTDPSLRIIEYCTDDPNLSDVHVVPMGLAGQIWPFFQPNYKACIEYATKLETKYKRVVAFIPTGWADASNYNKKNARKTIVKNGMTVSVRLVAYSEHSTFEELQHMVDFLQPRQVVPTVYSDSNDRRKIQARFRVDTTRAKEAFIQSMRTSAMKSTNCGERGQASALEEMGDDIRSTYPIKTDVIPSMSPHAEMQPVSQVIELLSGTESEEEHEPGKRDNTVQKRPATSISSGRERKRVRQTDIETLVSMGFARSIAEEALQASCTDLNAAIERLLQHPAASAAKPHTTPQSKSTTGVCKSTPPKKPSGTQSITKFFSPKKKG